MHMDDKEILARINGLMETERELRAELADGRLSSEQERERLRSAEEALESLRKMNPQNRFVTVDEVASLALLLASDDGRGINGQAINIDGGTVLV